MIGDQVAAVLGAKVAGVTALGTGAGGSGVYRVSLLSGETVFAKSYQGEAPGFLAAEAAGLRWLREADGAPVPEVLGEREDLLVTTFITPGRPTPAGAEQFGRELATMHARGAQSFGATWPGYIGALSMDNTESDDWPTFYAERRVLPYLRAAVRRGAMDAEQASAVERVCGRIEEIAGVPELPARLHGDLWAGNVQWDVRGRAWLIDPAAHGGHPETDLAMLALFGCPHPDAVFAGYQQVSPLAPGWPARVGLHQLFPLLVHVALFGRGYAGQAVAAARSTLRLADGLP
jgi:fructosamine-3-kinase